MVDIRIKLYDFTQTKDYFVATKYHDVNELYFLSIANIIKINDICKSLL